MVVLVAARADRSPAMRCEKNSMGRCRTFHMNDELDTTAILPSRRSRYMAFSTSTTMRTAPTAISKAMKGYSHSGFFPPSSRSMNTWESAGLMMPTTAVTAAVMATNASAAREPCRRGPTNSHTDRGLPLGWKSGPGTKRSMTPVKRHRTPPPSRSPRRVPDRSDAPCLARAAAHHGVTGSSGRCKGTRPASAAPRAAYGNPRPRIP